MKYTNLLGVNVICADQRVVMAQIDEWVTIHSEVNPIHTVSYVNAHCLNLAAKNLVYFQALQSFDLIYPDGIGAVWAGRWLTGQKLEKMTGADWIIPLCDLAQRKGWRLYILGGKTGVAQQAADNLHRQFPALKIVGTHDGYFSDAQADEVISEIVTLRPDILFVGLGVPMQEMWIKKWKSLLPVKVSWAVGALFDYVAGIEPRAPLWMRNLALEWLWRMWVDPMGKWKRYLLGNPLFLVRVVLQKIKQYG